MLKNIHTPVWANIDHSAINLRGAHPVFGEIPFTANPNDLEQHGRDIFARAVAGEFGAIKEYAPAKAAQIATINRQREAALDAGVAFNGNLYHADAVFQSQLQAFLVSWMSGLLAPEATVAIRRKDNVTVQMGQAEVRSLAAALMPHVMSVYAASWAAKDAVA